MPVTMELVRTMFEEALVEVWGASSAAKLSVDVVDVPPKSVSVLAALAYASDVPSFRAAGRSLFRWANHYTLKVAPELLDEDRDTVRLVLLHEAIHVGYGKHDARFEAVAKEVGTYSTETAMRTGGLYVVERQAGGKGSRFVKVHETTDKWEAVNYARDKKAGEGRYRVMY